jgi:hypothetical protein
MMEDHRPGEFLKPPHERKRGMWWRYY